MKYEGEYINGKYNGKGKEYYDNEKLKFSRRKRKEREELLKTNINITQNVKVKEQNLNENTYMEISYNNKIFKLNSRFYVKQNKLTYKYINCIHNYNICNSTITAIRNEINLKKCSYYLFIVFFSFSIPFSI